MADLLLPRRKFLIGLGALLVCAPAIVRATSIMPIKVERFTALDLALADAERTGYFILHTTRRSPGGSQHLADAEIIGQWIETEGYQARHSPDLESRFAAKARKAIITDWEGGGCGQLWFVQDWLKDHATLSRPSCGNGLPEVHAPAL